MVSFVKQLILFMRNFLAGCTPKASQKTAVGSANARGMAELLPQKDVSAMNN